MNRQPSLDDYRALYDRYDAVVRVLTDRGYIEDADYHMIHFFILFRDFETLSSNVANSEELLRSGEWESGQDS